jgi:hypothetical protein
MDRPRRPPRRAAAVAVVGGLLGACDSGDAATPPTSVAPAVSGATVAPTVPAADSEFCREMTELEARLVDEEDVAIALDDVVATYRRLLPSAPFEISAEVEAVADRIEREAAGDELGEDDVAVADEAALTIAQYVDANCQGVVNNPGPPPTAPP